MAEFVVSVAADLSGDVNAGNAVTLTVADHPAMVTALRSRSDALDFYVRHTTQGVSHVYGIANANTASCSVQFQIMAAIGAGGIDANYRLGFGDLGWQSSRAGGTPIADLFASAAYTFAAVALPAPGFVLPRTYGYDVMALDYPASNVVRRRARNENPRASLECEWHTISAEDWYEIRAFVASQYGGASTFTAPSWISDGGTWRIVPGTFSHEQASRRGYHARLSLEKVVA